MQDFSYGMQDLDPWPGLNPGLLPWGRGILATAPPGKSLAHAFSRPTSPRILGPTAPSSSSHLLQGQESLSPQIWPTDPPQVKHAPLEILSLHLTHSFSSFSQTLAYGLS